jgi:hypothetical protein
VILVIAEGLGSSVRRIEGSGQIKDILFVPVVSLNRWNQKEKSQLRKK